jgi:hypothetical protein
MQGPAGLPVHYRAGSGRGKGGRLSPGRAQLLAFVAFLGLLSIYVAYNVRALLATAATNRETRARDASLVQPIPEPEHQSGWAAAVSNPEQKERQAVAVAAVAPPAGGGISARQVRSTTTPVKQVGSVCVWKG